MSKALYHGRKSLTLEPPSPGAVPVVIYGTGSRLLRAASFDALRMLVLVTVANYETEQQGDDNR
jgi:hypothetical protein